MSYTERKILKLEEELEFISNWVHPDFERIEEVEAELDILYADIFTTKGAQYYLSLGIPLY
jgi:hypothetical protein